MQQKQEFIELRYFRGVWIEIERAVDCHEMQWCTSNVEQKYDDYERSLRSKLETAIPEATLASQSQFFLPSLVLRMLNASKYVWNYCFCKLKDLFRIVHETRR